MHRNVIQLNTVTKERANEEGLMNHRRKKKKEKKMWGEKEEEKAVETSRPTSK